MRDPAAGKRVPARARRHRRSRPGSCTGSGGHHTTCAARWIRGGRTPAGGPRAVNAAAPGERGGEGDPSPCPRDEPRYSKPGGELNTGCESALILGLGQVANLVNRTCSSSAILHSCRGTQLSGPTSDCGRAKGRGGGGCCVCRQLKLRCGSQLHTPIFDLHLPRGMGTDRTASDAHEHRV